MFLTKYNYGRVIHVKDTTSYKFCQVMRQNLARLYQIIWKVETLVERPVKEEIYTEELIEIIRSNPWFMKVLEVVQNPKRVTRELFRQRLQAKRIADKWQRIRVIDE